MTSEKNYLEHSLHLLQEWLPYDPESMQRWFDDHPDHFVIEKGKYVYCLFSYPCLKAMERCILLVYHEDSVIADLSGLAGNMDQLCFDQETKTYLMAESDWMDLEQYILEELYGKDARLDIAHGFLVSSAYVTAAYRRRHIFMTMENMMHEYVLRSCTGQTVYYSVMSLDPDIAVYGPDAVNSPYLYKYELDEPVRILNGKIAEEAGYRVIRLETDITGDGTKIWFAVKKEADKLVDFTQPA